MKKNTGPAFTALGASSLLTVFAVLCLTVFALLSLSTVQAEKRLADSALSAITGYYEADLRAEEIFARLKNGEMPAGVTAEEDTFHYSFPIGENQRLHVTVTCRDGSWKVLRWQTVTAERAAEETPLEVWTGVQEETP